jgi:hypothetical protein
VVSDGGTAVTVRGLVWSTTNPLPTINDQVLNNGQGIGSFNSTLSSLSEGPTYYVRAYATNKNGTGYSTVATSFKICNPFTVIHQAGMNGAPVSKTITYGTVSSNISGAARCWITQNLGADRQGTSAVDATETSAGWYWQFNRLQGYQHDGTTRTPSNAWTPWLSSITENQNWLPAQDPCILLLGSGWRLPTGLELITAEAVPQNWDTQVDTYNSALKIHAAGYLSTAAGGPLTVRGVGGYYWSSTTGNNGSVGKGLYNNGSVNVGDIDKALGMAVRCIRDEVIETLPSVSNVNVPVSGMTGTTAAGTAMVAPEGSAPVIERGLVWSSSEIVPTVTSNKIIDSGKGTGAFTGVISGLTEGPTYYVRAYAISAVGIAYSAAVSSFKICNPFTAIHKAGLNGAPVDKIITYKTVSSNISGAPRCWITQNLGASEQAISATDTNPAAAGWYWQFNRSQGYDVQGTVRTPAANAWTPWRTDLPENSDWTLANDPCNLLLGGGWRIPTLTEWTAADAVPQYWLKDVDAYNSVLKLHNAGWLVNSTGLLAEVRGKSGAYWSSNQITPSTGLSSMASFFQISSSGSLPVTGNYSTNYKAHGMTLRCLRDAVVLSKPVLTNVSIPVSGMKESSAEGSATVVSDGGAGLTARGLVWSTSNVLPSLSDQVLTNGLDTGSFKITLTGLAEGPTYYVRAYATNSQGTSYSPLVNSFKICNPFTVIHQAGLNGAPVSKTITYGVVSSNISGAARCWITQNLGSDRQATSATDATEASAGWYWQFNRLQGYQHDGTTRTPSNAWTPWLTPISENLNWLPTQDPCMLLLGSGWRLPTGLELTSAEAPPQNWDTQVETYNSALKIHGAGYLSYSGGGTLTGRGSTGYYWSSTMGNHVSVGKGLYNNGAVNVGDIDKSLGLAVRCIRDEVISTLPSVSNVDIPVSGMTSATAAGTAMVAPEGSAPVTERGLVWSSSEILPTIASNKIIDSGKGTGAFTGVISGLTEGPTYYVRAYAISAVGIAYSPVTSSFKICNPFTAIHKAGLNGAPVDKTIIYKTVSSSITGAPRCWITQNLGASEQAISATDSNPAAAGWYWQFNRSQGYDVQGTVRTPAANAWTPWRTDIPENSDWTLANDPCNLLLGGGWRIPTLTEWTAADAVPQYWLKDADAYNSVLRLHNAGWLVNSTGLLAEVRGKSGAYWSSNQITPSTGLSSMASFFQISSSGSLPVTGNYSTNYKAHGMTLRCLRDAVVLSKPVLTNVSIPVSGMKESSVEGSATVVSDGGAGLTARGLVWSTSNVLPSLSDQVLTNGLDTGSFKITLTGLAEGPTYYVRAYATNNLGTTYSPQVNSFKVCNPVTAIHVAGLNGAPVSKTVTYGAVSSNISGAARCWITQNLGSDRQATSATDATEASAGWYWQFNRLQGYLHDGTTRTPSAVMAPWLMSISENLNWLPAKDPCVLLLGSGWRLPTGFELATAEAVPQNWDTQADTYNSALKIHGAGYLAGGTLTGRGATGYYWSSTMGNSVSVGKGLYNNGAVNAGDIDKALGMAVRCIRDEVIETLPSMSNVEVPVSGMTSSTAAGTATLSLAGTSAVTERGLVWSGSETLPTVTSNKIIDNGKGTGVFTGVLSGLEEGPTYYVRAYAISALGTVYSPVTTSFKICNPLTVVHQAGVKGAAVDKTITYKTVSSSITGAARCWITQNLGASEQAISATDLNPAAAGWYWQFNRAQGYEYNNGTKIPATSGTMPWKTDISDNSDWTLANDPCALLLGAGWRIPTATEWTTADAGPQFWAKDVDVYNSVLKLHNAGYLNNTTAALIDTRGKTGLYWSTNQMSQAGYGPFALPFVMTDISSLLMTTNYAQTYKSNGGSLRCLK